MRVKANKTFWNNSRQIDKGVIFEADTTEGLRLIQLDLVKEYKIKRKTKELKINKSTKDGTSSRTNV